MSERQETLAYDAAEIEASAPEAGAAWSGCAPKSPAPTANAAAMREALLIVKRLFDGRIMFQQDIRKAHKAVDAALAKPPRNCEVGTAEEQRERMMEYCKTQEHIDGIIICERCPLHGPDWTGCVFKWAQMPYEKGEPDGRK